MSKQDSLEAPVAELAAFAADWTGFSRDAILPDAIRRGLLALLRTSSLHEVLARARAHDPSVVHAISQAVSVGETFFFRHPEQFHYLATEFVPRRLREGAASVRAWSAGCATGEETYSIAATLLDTFLVPGGAVSVLGTDLIDRNLLAAREGSYGNWSKRDAGPILHPLIETSSATLRVLPAVRAVTRFELHNLLEAPPPGGPFDLIFCRNVLVYFSPRAAETVVRHLVSALEPWGVLFFGPMDVSHVPHGFKRMGDPELQIFRRPDAAPPPAPKIVAPPAPVPAMPPPAPAPPRPPEPVALHLRALKHIERGERQVADRALSDLCRLVPDYVPGLIEHALLKMRSGQQAAAASLMRDVLRRTEKLAAETLLAGPEPLPVSFYRESANKFLRGAQGAER